MGILANQLTNDYGQLAQQAKPAALTAENEEVRCLAWGGTALDDWHFPLGVLGVRLMPFRLSHAHVCLQIGSHIKRRVQELGHGCAALVTKAGALQCSPSDAYTKKELIESARKVSEKVSSPEGFRACNRRGDSGGGRSAGLNPMSYGHQFGFSGGHPGLCLLLAILALAQRVEEPPQFPPDSVPTCAVIGVCNSCVLTTEVLSCQGVLITPSWQLRAL